MSEDVRERSVAQAWGQRDHLNAFYSGHSLSDGIPKVVEQIARSLGHRLNFEVQVLGYSLLRQRTKGEDAASPDWPGYRAGHNRNGAGLDVSDELQTPRRLPPGEKYDVLVVTERHDLPGIARKERTSHYLTEMARKLVAGNPEGEVLLYHTWLNIDVDAPWRWINYERAVAPMWECIASRANLDLAARGDIPRVRVLPGGGALAELAAALWDGKVPGVVANTPGARVRLLFSDTVHMSDIGRYYMALLHYSVLFGHNPEGSVLPAFISPEMGKYLQTLAWQYARSYGERADAAVQRDMAACRTLMQESVCPAYAEFLHGSGLPVLTALKRSRVTNSCRRDYADAENPENPFGTIRK